MHNLGIMPSQVLVPFVALHRTDDLACYYLALERSCLVSETKYSNYPGELKCQGRFSISSNRNWISDIRTLIQ